MTGLAGRGIAPHWGLRLPVIQAPMAGGITPPALVAAVSEAGALGSLAAALLTPERIRAEVAAIRAATDRPFAVNLFVLDEPERHGREGEAEAIARLAPWRARYGLPPQTSPQRVCISFAAQLETVIELAPPVVSFHFGLPPQTAIDALQRAGSRVIGTATRVAEAQAWAGAGADAVVAQGAEAGGHRGTFLGGAEEGAIGTLALVPRVVAALAGRGLPVIAAGGIMDGAGILAACALGAAGVQLGTAFLACEESGAHPAWKAALTEADARGTRLTRAFSGRMARGLVNGFMEAMRPHEDRLPGYPVHNALTTELRAAAARAGDIEAMSLWAGQAAAAARRLPVGALIAALEAEFETTLLNLNRGQS